MNLIHPFLVEALGESVNNSCQTILGIPGTLKDKTIFPEEPCIISSIGFTGNIEGNFSIYISDSNACRLVSKMLQTEIDETTTDVIDGIAEMINVIAGGVKMRIAQQKQTFNISIPTTIKGSRMVILASTGKAENICLHFSVENICLSVTLIYKMHEDKKAVEERKAQAHLDAMQTLNALINNKN